MGEIAMQVGWICTAQGGTVVAVGRRTDAEIRLAAPITGVVTRFEAGSGVVGYFVVAESGIAQCGGDEPILRVDAFLIGLTDAPLFEKSGQGCPLLIPLGVD